MDSAEKPSQVDGDGNENQVLDRGEGVAALHCAVYRQDVQAVQDLLAAGVDPDEPDWSGCGDAALLQAVVAGNENIVRALCGAGCSVNARRVNGQSALLLAITSRPSRNSSELLLSLVEGLLLAHANPDVREKLQGQAPLHALAKAVAADPRDDSLVQAFRLLAIAADVNIQDHRRRTALHHLAVNGCQDPEPYKILLERGADASIQNARGETALVEYLERDCSDDLAEGVLRLLSVRDLVHGGTHNGGRRKVLNHPLRQATQYGETALHVAARRNRPKAVEVALAAGADPHDQDIRGNTALHLSAARGYQDVVGLLLATPGIQVNATNRDGFTALHMAVESGFVTVVNMLLGAESVDIGATTGQGQSVLDLAQQEYRRRAQPELAHTLAQEINRRFSISSNSSIDLGRSCRSFDGSSLAEESGLPNSKTCRSSVERGSSTDECNDAYYKKLHDENDDSLCGSKRSKVTSRVDSKTNDLVCWNSDSKSMDRLCTDLEAEELFGEHLDYLGIQIGLDKLTDDAREFKCPVSSSIVDTSFKNATDILLKLKACEEEECIGEQRKDNKSEKCVIETESRKRFCFPANPYATIRAAPTLEPEPKCSGTLTRSQTVNPIQLASFCDKYASLADDRPTEYPRSKSVEKLKFVEDSDIFVESLLEVAKGITCSMDSQDLNNSRTLRSDNLTHCDKDFSLSNGGYQNECSRRTGLGGLGLRSADCRATATSGPVEASSA